MDSNLTSCAVYSSSLFARIRHAVKYLIEFYVESSVELRCIGRFDYVMVVLRSRFSTGLRALFRDDQVVILPNVITLPPLPPLLLLLPRPLSLASSTLSKLSLFVSFYK